MTSNRSKHKQIFTKKNIPIAYSRIEGKSPYIVFIHGLMSDMNGTKAIALEKFAIKNNQGFIRFDCRGHGFSGGKFHDYGISDCPNNFKVIARSNDNSIEAIKHCELPWEGWMWHPEREPNFNKRDLERLRSVFDT